MPTPFTRFAPCVQTCACTLSTIHHNPCWHTANRELWGPEQTLHLSASEHVRTRTPHLAAVRCATPLQPAGAQRRELQGPGAHPLPHRLHHVGRLPEWDSVHVQGSDNATANSMHLPPALCATGILIGKFISDSMLAGGSGAPRRAGNVRILTAKCNSQPKHAMPCPCRAGRQWVWLLASEIVVRKATSHESCAALTRRRHGTTTTCWSSCPHTSHLPLPTMSAQRTTTLHTISRGAFRGNGIVPMMQPTAGFRV